MHFHAGVNIYPPQSELHDALIDLWHATGVYALQPMSLPFRADQVGLTARHLARLAKAGKLTRIRRGWYGWDSVDPVLRTAVCAGGTATCITALQLHGAWHVTDTPHLCLPANRAAPPGAVSHRNRRGQGPGPYRLPLSDDPLTALGVAVGCLDRVQLTMVTDSLLNRRLITPAELDHRLSGLSRRQAAKLRYIDGRAESGTESRVRLWLLENRFKVEPQVQFEGIGRVDLVVGRVVIECDSVAHHSGPQHYIDRARSLALEALGYRVIRLSYPQVMFQWDETCVYLLEVLRSERAAARRHRPGFGQGAMPGSER